MKAWKQTLCTFLSLSPKQLCEGASQAKNENHLNAENTTNVPTPPPRESDIIVPGCCPVFLVLKSPIPETNIK